MEAAAVTFRIEQPVLKRYPVSFPADCAIDAAAQARQMEVALRWGFRPLALARESRPGTINIVGYAPSLADTWRRISGPTMTVSGAHDYLLERGIRPDWHCDVDPRPHKADLITPHPLVRYCMGTVCHPAMWDRLLFTRGKGRWWGPLMRRWMHGRIRTFHLVNSDETIPWVEANDPGSRPILIGGGMVGITAVHVAAALGFRRMHCFGMDCSFGHGALHAGRHGGSGGGRRCFAWAGGRWWASTTGMVTAVEETLHLINTTSLEIAFEGEGLLQARVRAHRKGEGWKFDPAHLRVA